MEPDIDTVYLHDKIDRGRQGDDSAVNELLIAIQANMQRLARKMLRSFPGVARWEQVEDVVQNASLRLMRSLEDVRPENRRAFFNLVAVHIRRELLDLTRRYQGPLGLGANHDSVCISGAGATDLTKSVSPTAPESDDRSLDRWASFHEAVEKLPIKEREVVSLIFYQGWTHAQIAELLGRDEKTVARRLKRARTALIEALGEDFLS